MYYGALLPFVEPKLTFSRRNNDASAVHIGIPRTRPFSQLSAVKV